MRRLVIVGAGGHGKVVADAAEEMGKWQEIVFIDAKYPDLQSCGTWPVTGDDFFLEEDSAEAFDSDDYIVAVGPNKTRLKLYRDLVSRGKRIATIIHPSAVISKYSEIGEGSMILAGAVINVDTRLGKACILNTGCTVDHDCVLNDAVHISPGANIAGEVTIGECAWVGIGSCVKQQLIIGAHSTVGAGSTVVKDVAVEAVVAGTPAKKLNSDN